ncbi:MAG: cytochrome d ubiquinol oxidase subunit II [Gammaproteobacteria bacterium]|nr:cytochrome d ubiquinol oxidase subunit II [Gammaproteobacteria bacterium]
MSPESLSGAAYWLPLACAAVIALAVALYVILDGFDLGIGILFPFFPEESARDQMMSSVAPFWDGNETWLVMGGAGLFVAFPLAYAVIMPAHYLPVILMLLGLVFRGVSFEFRGVAKPHHRRWDIAFAAGSVAAAFAQGLILGGILRGIPVRGGEFAGGPWHWLTAFSLACGVSLVIGYALLGACWLVMKTSGAVEARARQLALPLLAALLACIVVVSIWTPLVLPRVAQRWFSWPNLLYLSPVPVGTGALFLSCWQGLKRGAVARAFYSAVGLFVMAYLGLLLSSVPYLVPPDITLWQAAAAPRSQQFILIGIALMIPVILGYTVFVYRTFRGKVQPGQAYH